MVYIIQQEQALIQWLTSRFKNIGNKKAALGRFCFEQGIVEFSRYTELYNFRLDLGFF